MCCCTVFTSKGDVNTTQWNGGQGWFGVVVTSPALVGLYIKCSAGGAASHTHHLGQRGRGGAGAILFLEVALRRAAAALVNASHHSIAPSSLKSLPGQTGKGITNRAAAAALVKETKAQRCVCVGELDSSAFKYPPLCANALSSFCHLPCFTLFLSFHITDVPRCFHMLSTGITEMWGFPYLKANKLP